MVGRKLDLEKEVKPVGEEALLKTFFKNGKKALLKSLNLKTRISAQVKSAQNQTNYDIFTWHVY